MNIFALDIGIGSVGFAVLETDHNGDPTRIVTAGSRVFDHAEVPKTGASLAAPRRLARGSRRRTRRHAHRLDRIRGLLQSSGVISRQELENTLQSQKNLPDIYQIRCDALDRSLTPLEFARLMVHLAQRRGFLSNRKNQEEDKEMGLLLSAVEANKERMLKHNYRTIGEMLLKDPEFAEYKRNKQGDYRNTVARSMMVEEIDLIFQCQREFENPFATEEFQEKYLSIFTSQRSFEDGPGGESPYGGNQIEKMVGRCTFYPDLPRAVKGSYTCECFTLWQKINQLILMSPQGKRVLSQEERQLVFDLAHKTKELTYKSIRKNLHISPDYHFNMLTYGEKEMEKVEGAKFTFLKNYHEMKKAFEVLGKNYIKNISTEQRDNIATIFTYYKTESTLLEKLQEIGLSPEEVEVLSSLKPFDKMGNLSLKAMSEINPFLAEGKLYHEACACAGFDFKGHCVGEKSQYLPPLPEDTYDITSPVVKRAVRQTIKVVNALVKQYGSPCKIHVELARDTSRNYAERTKIQKNQEDNQKKNERILKRLETEFGVSRPTGLDIMKLKLWEEQDGRCAYTMTPLLIEQLFQVGYCEIDHIIPYSQSFDDSYLNKVLVHKKANQDKGNRVPMEYVPDTEVFRDFVNMTFKNYRKRQNLLKLSFTEEDSREMKERNLTDTKYISKFMLNYLNDNLLFDARYTEKKKVIAVNGQVTAYVRKRWGLSKLRENGDLHHAQDAIVIGCITDGIIQKVTRFMKYQESRFMQEESQRVVVDETTGEVLAFHHFPEPWVNFRKELEYRFSDDPTLHLERVNLPNYLGVELDTIKPFFVSRMKRKKITGQAHKETITSGRVEGYTLKKAPLHKLRLTKDKQDILDYYNPDSDRLLYEVLLQRLQALEGKTDQEKEIAFREAPMYKPTPKGGTAPVVKKVKLQEKASLSVPVNHGVAGNGSMVRIDIFHVKGDGYYMVPIYIADMVKSKEHFPNQAVVSGGKPWKEMKDEDFLFSLYHNDLIKVTDKNPMTMTLTLKGSNLPSTNETNEVLVYYQTANISIGTIRIITHDNAYEIGSKGIKTLVKLEKYVVDVLGNYQVCGKETRKYPNH